MTELEGPMVKIVSGPTSGKQGISDAVTGGMSSIFSTWSQAVDLAPMEAEDLLNGLRVRVYEAKQAAARGNWFIGRLLNHSINEDSNYIELSGQHLLQTLAIVGIDGSDKVSIGGTYKLRRDKAEQAMEVLEARLREQSSSEKAAPN